ncbi:MAG: aminotransferase class I/II-fold pyridoxal phosphate-dependent enzyme [Ruminococcus bromii]|nr:aminotransferase class I/II-fold pyridoxal phosphate-dependent enzyme [Ruminococcus bromii]MDY4711393.1 aminotransferase class I/II-fold pyridoxal phosphate-dependent enzyme [Ruminococcus bromii]
MLFDKLKEYTKNGIYPFHMPGHKRNNIDEDGIIPYEIDLTEIEGFDNLHSPNNCIKNIEEKAERLYSVNKTFLLVNGATCGILSSIRAMTRAGDKVIVARNCHISVYNAIEICSLEPIYIMPDLLDDFGINNSISPLQIENALKDNPDTSLVIITSPTYEGIVSDIRLISDICHKYGAKLFVDEAHGAHFPFSDRFPSEAVQSGADVAVVSLHKTLPSLTQTALLLTNDNSICNALQANLSIFESSSPSYILMASIEKCLDYIIENGNDFKNYTDNLDSFYCKTQNLKNIKVLYNQKNICSSYFDYDFGKILISTSGTTINGKKLAKILRENYKIETEMSYTNYVLAMTSVCDSEQGFTRLADSLIKIDKELRMNPQSECHIITELPCKRFKSSQRFNFTPQVISLKNAENKISLEYIWAYPPGIPIIVPGEIISNQIIDTIFALKKNNIDIYSSEKMVPNFITVAKTD